MFLKKKIEAGEKIENFRSDYAPVVHSGDVVSTGSDCVGEHRPSSRPANHL